MQGGPNFPVGVQVVRHPTLDVALVRLNQAPQFASLQPFAVTRRPYNGSNASLVSQQLYTQGWGSNQVYLLNGVCQGGGTSNLRSATLPITQMLSGSRYEINTSLITTGQIIWTGDSGSSLYASTDNLARPIG